MTPHTPLIEALKELDSVLQSAQISLGALAVDPDADRPKFVVSPIAEDERCLQDAFQSIDEARDLIRSRLSTETQKPADAQSIRAEAFKRAGDFIEDIVGAFKNEDARRKVATAIRSLAGK